MPDRPSPASSSRVPAANNGSSSKGISPVVDPTKNVLDLVNAESKYQDAMREAESKRQDGLRATESLLQNALRDAEKQRQNDLASLTVRYETRISDMLASSVKSTSELLSTQVSQLTNNLTDRIASLEKFRYEISGKTSVADPAMADAINLVAKQVQELKLAGTTSAGREVGRSDVWGWVVAAVALGVGITVIAGFIIARVG